MQSTTQRFDGDLIFATSPQVRLLIYGVGFVNWKDEHWGFS